MKKRKATFLTFLTSIFNSVIISFLGLIYNQKIIDIYGSNVNGLISAFVQFVSAFTIIEGGFSTAATVAMYRMVANKNLAGINNILWTVKKKYHRFGIISFLLSMTGGLFYLQFIDSPFSNGEAVTLLMITAVSITGSLAYLSAYNVIYNGYNCQYRINFFALISKIIAWTVSIILIINHYNIVIVYLANSSNIIFNVMICEIDLCFVNRLKPKQGKYDVSLIKGSRDAFIQKIANTVFTSTDLVLISTCVGLAEASVYNVYFLLYSAVNRILISFLLAPLNSFGHFYNEGNVQEFNRLFSAYQKIVMLFGTSILAVAGISSVGFVKVYTKNITDINYIIPSLAVLFFAQFFFILINQPYGMYLNISGNFEKQNIQCILAAVINLAVSIIGMYVYGIQGIILGSIIGAVIICSMNFFQLLQFDSVLSKKNLGEIIINFFIGSVLILIFLYVFKIFPSNYYIWLVISFFEFICTVFLVCLVNIVISKDDTIEAIKIVWHILKQRVNR